MKTLAIIIYASFAIAAQPPVEKQPILVDSMPADITKSSAESYELSKRGDKKQQVDTVKTQRSKPKQKK